jgi:hypothetical protein
LKNSNAPLGKYVRGGPPAETKFDMGLPPVRLKWYLAPLVWAVSYIMKWTRRARLHKSGTEGLKPPYILACNHNAFFDFFIMQAAIRSRRAIIPVAVDGFIGREGLLRGGGGIPKRKYTADIGLIKRCLRVLKGGGILVLYAEARYSLCGLTGDLIPEAVGQLAKGTGVPLVTLKCCGHHILDPYWGDHKSRPVKGTEAFMTQIFTAEEIKATSPEEINARLREHLRHDDFRWQSENRVRNAYKKRAEGLHKPLYQCPACMAEYRMNSRGARLLCEACGKSWTLGEYGELTADAGETEFAFPTDWYEWERAQVRKEIQAGAYHFECDVHVNDLPNAGGFVRLGNGRLVHDMDGFRLTGARDWDGAPFAMDLPAAETLAVHVEYSYIYGNGRDCVDLNTLEDTWYCYPEGRDFSVTKISLAAEEMFKHLREGAVCA